MPREIVHCDGPWHVKIGWADNRDVQLGVEGDEGRSLTWLLYGDETSRERIGREVHAAMQHLAGEHAKFADAEIGSMVLNVLDCVPHMLSVDEPREEGVTYGFRGVWADLSRHGCNRLIKLLRKARDAAYGADA